MLVFPYVNEEGWGGGGKELGGGGGEEGEGSAKAMFVVLRFIAYHVNIAGCTANQQPPLPVRVS